MTGNHNSSSPPLKLDIAVPGTFWAFRIAEEVTRRGGSVEIFTSEPRFRRNSENVSATVHEIRYPFFLEQVGYQLPFLNRLLRFTGYNRPFKRWGDYLFSQSVARDLQSDRAEDGLFLGFAGACRDALRRANDLGYVTAVERSSTHIRTQREILREEFERHGVDGQPISDVHVEREEQEYANADYIVTPSEFTVSSFRDQGVDQEKLIRIPFGANVDSDPSRQENNGPVRYLYAGHVSLRKGIQYLLPAWERASLPEAELLVAGNIDGAIEEILDEYENRESIRFLGWVDDMDTLYEKASAFVLPTLEEGSARVTYEAMARGLPVITTPNSGWVGKDGEHGIEVPIRDVEGLSDGLEQVYQDDSFRHQLGNCGQELIESRYTWENYGERIWKAYRKMSTGR